MVSNGTEQCRPCGVVSWVHGAWLLLVEALVVPLICHPRAAQEYLLTYLGPLTCPKRARTVLACCWNDFQAKSSILDQIHQIQDQILIQIVLAVMTVNLILTMALGLTQRSQVLLNLMVTVL